MAADDRLSGPEAAALYSKLMKDRAASLPVEEAVAVVSDVLRAGASLRRLIAGHATSSNSREPAAAEATAPRPAAAEAPASSGTSPLATRVLTALMDMPDAEFLALANKVVARYHAAVEALAPPGVRPFAPESVECIHCHKVQTHRVCAQCLEAGK